MNVKTSMSKAAIDELTGLGHLRVWSLIVTIFGDAVRPRGGVAPSAALAELTGAMGIRPEAFRVALSRLTRDGWIERAREGRNSFYRLSRKGRETFGPASERIYARAPARVEAWQLVAAPEPLEIAHHAEIAPRLRLGPAGAVPPEAVVVAGALQNMPAWARQKTVAEDVVVGYAALAAAMRKVLAEVRASRPDPLSAAAIRTLAVHQWRRLVLRHEDWPPELFPEGWQGELCRELFHELLAALDPEASTWFDEAFAAGMEDANPRFRS